jgi:hypothetical protein
MVDTIQPPPHAPKQVIVVHGHAANHANPLPSQHI